MAQGGGIEDWYRGLPKVTRGYMTAAMGTTVLVQLELLAPTLLFGFVVGEEDDFEMRGEPISASAAKPHVAPGLQATPAASTNPRHGIHARTASQKA